MWEANILSLLQHEYKEIYIYMFRNWMLALLNTLQYTHQCFNIYLYLYYVYVEMYNIVEYVQIEWQRT